MGDAAGYSNKLNVVSCHHQQIFLSDNTIYSRAAAGSHFTLQQNRINIPFSKSESAQQVSWSQEDWCVMRHYLASPRIFSEFVKRALREVAYFCRHMFNFYYFVAFL